MVLLCSVVIALLAALGACLLAQAASLGYGYDKVLHGTPEARGGLAGDPDPAVERSDWIDDALEEGERVAIIPAVRGVGSPWGGAEREQMFNRRLDAVVRLSFTNARAPRPPGYALVSTPLVNGLASWSGPKFRWLVAQRDDPRVQYGGRRVRRSPSSRYALWELRGPASALWTAVGLHADAVVVKGRPVSFRLDRRRALDVRRVDLVLQGLVAARGPVRWNVTRLGKQVASGRTGPSARQVLRLDVPPCPASDPCRPITWRLTAAGPATALALPDFGPVGKPRDAMLRVSAARMGTERGSRGTR